MKNIRAIFFLMAIALGVGFTACDKVEGPYKVESGNSGDQDGDFVQKAVLFEFTGHKCPNCPSATEVAHTLKENYKDKLAIVAVHAGFYAMVDGEFPLDLNTDKGTILSNDLNVGSLPIGIVNWEKHSSSGTVLVNHSNWSEQLSNVYSKTPHAGIKLESTPDKENNKLSVKAKVTFDSEVKEQYNLVVMLTEDDIIGKQKKAGQPTIENYHHMHVLRATLTDVYGNQVYSDESPEPGKEYTLDFNDIEIKSEWNMDNMNIVAFLMKNDGNIQNRHIIQAEELKVVE